MIAAITSGNFDNFFYCPPPRLAVLLLLHDLRIVVWLGRALRSDGLS